MSAVEVNILGRIMHESDNSGCWTFGPFQLDQHRFELTREGRPLRVQPKVFELLLYLVRNRGRVVCKAELLDNVWPNVTVTEASLSQAVSLARKVLGDDARAQRYLRTVRGRGLQFVGVLAPSDPPSPSSSQGVKISEGSERLLLVRLVDGKLHVSVQSGA